MESLIKGFEYEKYIETYIRTTHNKDAYIWKHIPEKYLIESGLVHTHNQHRMNRKTKKETGENFLIDVGVDIMQIDHDHKKNKQQKKIC